MSRYFQFRWLAPVVAASVLVLNSASAAEPGADARADVVANLGTAAELAAFGNGEMNELTGMAKDFRSPEALVAAGIILVKAHKMTGGQQSASPAEVLDDEGKSLPADGKPQSLLDQANDLFATARGLAEGERAQALEKQIKLAMAQELRPAVGGPRMIARTIQTGKTHNIKIDFEPNAPACVTMMGSGGTKFEVIGNGGNVLWHSQGAWGSYQWFTGGKGEARNVTVRIRNPKGAAVAYKVTTN